MEWEREFLGLYVTDHPFKTFKQKLEGVITPYSTLKENLTEKRVVRVGGVVASIKKIMTKKGDPMLFVILEDGITNLELLVFPRLYKEKEDIVWAEGKILIAEGTTSDKDDELKILCNNIWEVDDANSQTVVSELQETPFQEVQTGKRRWTKKEDNQGRVIFSKKKVLITYPIGASKDFAEKVNFNGTLLL